MKVLVFGAGVIGRIYAARLLTAGHAVQLVARGETARQLRLQGIALHRIGGRGGGGAMAAVFPGMVESAQEAEPADVAFIAIRRDQLEAALPQIAAIRADTVASLVNLPAGLDLLAETVGSDRLVPAFPGVAGRLGPGGVVEYLELAQQPTAVGFVSPTSEGRADAVSALLGSAGLRTARVDDMPAWLKTHAVFIAAFESALAARGGDAQALASERRAVRELVLAVREGFTALARRGTTVTPAALRIIFQRMPVWFATAYWRRQLGGDVGRLGLAPHALATRGSELPALQQDVRAILGAVPTPRLDALFAGAGPD